MVILWRLRPLNPARENAAKERIAGTSTLFFWSFFGFPDALNSASENATKERIASTPTFIFSLFLGDFNPTKFRNACRPEEARRYAAHIYAVDNILIKQS
jgi:hypothetical protein